MNTIIEKIRDDDKIIEYIRKDALLEWAKERLELTIGNGVYAKGKRDSYQELIKHIESL